MELFLLLLLFFLVKTYTLFSRLTVHIFFLTDQSGENKTAIIADVPVAATLVGVVVGVVVMVLVICCIYKSRM